MFEKLQNTRSGISVGFLSRVSDKLQNVAKDETVKKTSLIVAIILCAFFLADLFALMFEKYLPSPPASPLSMRQSGGNGFASPIDYEIIINRNIFSSKEPTKNKNEIDLDAEPVPTTLPFQLIGTIIFKNTMRSMGTILDKGESKIYPIRAGDEIEGRAQILSVEARRVVFINPVARRKEMVELPEDPTQKITYSSSASRATNAGVVEVQENNFSVKRAEIDSQLANWNTLITQALAVPEMEGGQMQGFRLRQVQKGSFYEKLGIHENDLITAVNGEKLTDVAKAASLLQDLKTMNSLNLGLKRNGKDINLNYDIQQ